MKALIFYFNKDAFYREPEKFFNSADETEKMLNETGLQNFAQVDTFEEETTLTRDEFAERLFAIYNDGAEINNPLGTPEGQKKIQSLGVGHTSMSVSDFVVIDGEVLIVDVFGFKNIGKHNALSEVTVN